MATSHDELPIWDSARPPVVTIRCGGEDIKPFIRPLNVLFDECRMHFEDDGVYVNAVDAANVMTAETRIHAAAFDEYEVDEEVTVGVNLSRAAGLVKRARMNQDDELTLSVSQDELRANISRDTEGVTIVTNDAIRTIDPESIRSEPELPDLLGGDYGYGTSTLPFSALAEATDHVLSTFDHLRYTSEDGQLYVEPMAVETVSKAACIEGHGNGVSTEAGYSGDYLADAIRALRQSGVSEVSLSFADEYPYVLDAERTRDGDVIQETTIMQAPRLTS